MHDFKNMYFDIVNNHRNFGLKKIINIEDIKDFNVVSIHRNSGFNQFINIEDIKD